MDLAPENDERGRLEAGAMQFARFAPDKDEQKRLEAAVNAILPSGYRITRTAVGAAPPDWHTNEPAAGFLIEGGDGHSTFRICFLPLDWIGIRKRHNDAPRTCYWEGILDGERYKTITAGDDDFQKRVQARLGEARGGTPSLVNSGYHRATEIFSGRQKEVDRKTQALMKKHCREPEEFAEAAHSLIVLGVPAKAVFLRAAREVDGDYKDLFCSVLGLLGGEDAIGVLCEVMTDAKQDDMRRKYAAMALDGHADGRIGPALHKAIKELNNSEAVGGVARVLMHQRYSVAAPDVLDAMKRIDSDYYKIEVAHCLAGMRYAEAIPEVRRLSNDLRRRGEVGPTVAHADIDLALQRFTGDWGKAGKAMRVRLSAPADVIAGETVLLRIDIENVGPDSFRSWNMPSGLVINGREWDAGHYIGGGISYSIRPGDVHSMSWDLAADLKEPGKYTLKYALSDGCSNEITIHVRARENR
jgi:hypothetical protein